MTFTRKSGGGNVALTTVKRRSGGAWANVQTIKRRLSGAWVTVWTAYTPISNVQHADIYYTKDGTETYGQPATTLTAPTWSGGNPNPTITWAVVTGGAIISGGTTLEASDNLASGSSVSGTVKVTVSDGVSSASKTINYTLTYQQLA